MNKEEIEEIKRLLFQDRLTQYGKRKLVNYLEQKETILDKVTDELKEDINRFDKIIKDKRIWGEQKVEFKKYKNYAINLLNIIEGEKK